MKKLFLAIAAVATLLASCSKEDGLTGVSKSQVTFTVSSPEMATRAGDYGNGKQATELYYAVYDAVEGGLVPGLSKTTQDNHEQLDAEGKATVSLNLVEGRTYTIIFYAEHNFNPNDETKKSPYTIDWPKQTLTVDYQNLKANQETYDAFYAHVDNLKVGTAAINETVYLRRPFAQLNVLTNDLDKGTAAGIDIAQTSVTVKNIYTKMNLFTDKVDPESEAAVTYALSDVLKNDQGAIVSAVVDNTTYHWLTMNYLLVNDKKMVDVEFTMTDSSVADGKDNKLVRNYSTVPVERNHRTNIYGSIITNPAKFNVEIKPDFLTPDHDYPADNVVTTTEELQAALDAAKDGSTIILEEGVDYDVVYLGRPTKFNNTEMACGSEFTTTDAAAFAVHLNDGKWHTTPNYTTTLKNVTILGAKGATIAGLIATSGHVTGDVYDYVLDKDYDSGSAYYHTLHLENINFTNVAFTGKVDINTSREESTYDGITFDGCTFTTGGTTSDNGAAIRYYNEANNGNVKNIVVKNCKFNNCYQGVYVHNVNGITITDNEFDTTGHNAIAIQSHDGAVNLKNVVINNNTFKNIGDRVIRFNEVGADSNITIQYNTATNSGDSDGEVMKATSIASGITTNIGFNNWGAGKVVNDELKDKSALVATAEELSSAIKNGITNVFFANDITVDKWIMFSETKTIGNGNIITVKMDGLTIDGKGHTLTVNSIESAGNGNHLFDNASNLNISNLTIKKNCGGGAISLKSGVISKVNFVGGGYGIHPGEGEIKVEECTFATADGDAIYFEQERDNLTINSCTFNQLDGENVVLLRGDVKFTNNIINSGRTVNVVSGSPVVTGNDFKNVRLKVYSAATATISDNIINNLEFETSTYSSTFTNNTLSATAQAALNAATKN